ncbi:hypothetical protein SM007_28895 [Streptomyces avermitilis]|nr:hypothetical protein SM007_28895 [Streptomyces avermitilis]
MPMTPPAVRTWSRRGRTPVVRVRSRRRISPRPGRHPVREVPCPRHCSCWGQGTSRTCARRSVQVAERTASARAVGSGASSSGRRSPGPGPGSPPTGRFSFRAGPARRPAKARMYADADGLRASLVRVRGAVQFLAGRRRTKAGSLAR